MVEIISYQNSWPLIFRGIAFNLRQGLGNLALRIDHIGSTAIPSLAAKDIIDIQVTVSALDQRILAAMESLGFVRSEISWRDHRPPNSQGPDSDWQKWLFKPSGGQHPAHIHIREQGRANQRYSLLFRDYLRQHPATAEAYAELKRQLAQHLADPEVYPEVKDPAVDLIYLAAEDWVKAVGWEPGRTDA